MLVSSGTLLAAMGLLQIEEGGVLKLDAARQGANLASVDFELLGVDGAGLGGLGPVQIAFGEIERGLVAGVVDAVMGGLNARLAGGAIEGRLGGHANAPRRLQRPLAVGSLAAHAAVVKGGREGGFMFPDGKHPSLGLGPPEHGARLHQGGRALQDLKNLLIRRQEGWASHAGLGRRGLRREQEEGEQGSDQGGGAHHAVSRTAAPRSTPNRR